MPPPSRFRLRFTYEENGAMRVCRQVLFQHDLFTSSVDMLAFVEGLSDLKDILGDSDPSKNQFTAKEFGFYVPGHQFKGRKQAIAKDEDLAVMNGLYESCSARSSVYLFYRLTKDNRNFAGRRSMKLPTPLSPSVVEVTGSSASHETSATDGAVHQEPETPQSDGKGSLARGKRRHEDVGAAKRASLDEGQTVQGDAALEPTRKLVMARPAYWTGTNTAQLVNVAVADGDDGTHENLFKVAPMTNPVAQIRQKMEVRGGLLSQLKLIQDMTNGEVSAPSAVFKKAADGVMEDLQELEKIGVAGTSAPARQAAAETMATQSGVAEMDNSLGGVVIVQTGNEDTSFY